MTVWTARHPQRKYVGRWHVRADCWTIAKGITPTARSREEAEARGFHECPMCCPLPACCLSGAHTSIQLPRWEASERSAELERELEEGERG